MTDQQTDFNNMWRVIRTNSGDHVEVVRGSLAHIAQRAKNHANLVGQGVSVYFDEDCLRKDSFMGDFGYYLPDSLITKQSREVGRFFSRKG